MTPATRIRIPTRASSYGLSRPGVTALPPAQQAWAHARVGSPIATRSASTTLTRWFARSKSAALLRDVERRRRMVRQWAGESRPKLPVPRHEKVDIGKHIRAVTLDVHRRNDGSTVTIGWH